MKTKLNKAIKTSSSETFNKHLALYVKGRKRAITAFIVLFLIAGFAFMIETMTGASWKSLLVTSIAVTSVSLIYLFVDTQLRQLVYKGRKTKLEIEDFINDVLQRMNTGLVITGDKKHGISMASIMKLKLYADNGYGVKIRHHNTLSGTINNSEDIEIHNIDIIQTPNADHKKDRNKRVFSGSIYVKDLPVLFSKTYYLSIAPSKYQKYKDYRVIKNKYITHEIPKDFNIESNSSDTSEVIINTHISHHVHLFDILDVSDKNDLLVGLNVLLERDSEALVGTIHTEKPTNRIESLAIHGGKLYVFFPFKYAHLTEYAEQHRVYPFDLTMREHINTQYLLDDINDIYERTEIVQSIHDRFSIYIQELENKRKKGRG